MYKDYEQLKSHFKRSHFMCEEEECLANLFTVFNSQSELDFHIDKVHRKQMVKKGGKAVYNATNLVRVRIADDSDGEQEIEQAQAKRFELKDKAGRDWTHIVQRV